jgi:hypothetical protein
MKLLMCTFDQLSGLKINFHKIELFCYGATKDHEVDYSQIFGCRMGTFPLGIPMHHRKLRNIDWKEVEKRFQKKLTSWRSKLLSHSVLSSLSIFMLSFF